MYQEGIRIALSAREFEDWTTHWQARTGHAPHVHLLFSLAASSLVEGLSASGTAVVLDSVSQISAEIQRAEGHRHHRQNRNHQRLREKTASDGETISRRARQGNVTRVMSCVTEVTWRSGLIRAHGPRLFFSSTCLAAPALRKLPFAEQLLGVGAHGKAEQLGEVGGTVNIERDPGKIGIVEHD
jgi:hypothetical protein